MIGNKFLIILILAFLTSACGSKEDKSGSKEDNSGFEQVCIDKVMYLIKEDGNGHRGYMSVKMNPDSTVVTCNLV